MGSLLQFNDHGLFGKAILGFNGGFESRPVGGIIDSFFKAGCSGEGEHGIGEFISSLIGGGLTLGGEVGGQPEEGFEGGELH